MISGRTGGGTRSDGVLGQATAVGGSQPTVGLERATLFVYDPAVDKLWASAISIPSRRQRTA